MPIPSTRYVEITSAVVGASSVATQSLTGRRFTSNPLAPIGTILTVLNGGAQDYFGAQSDEAVFAAQYFGYVSPAPASRANNLQFAAYAPAGRAPSIFGGRNPTSLADLKLITDGSLSIQLGDTNAELDTISLATVTSFADVANVIQAALRAAYADPVDPQLSQVTVTYDALQSSFNITGGTITAAQAAVLPSGIGTDLGVALNLGGLGSVQSPGSIAQTPLDAFIAAENISDSFGSATFSDEDVTLDDAIALATYVASKNVKYQIHFSVSRTNWQAWSAALLNIASTGLVLNATAGQYKESLPMAIMAAIDYDRRNSAVNFMFRQGPLTGDVTDATESLQLDAARVNYYGTTASAGQRIEFFQRGFLMGGVTAPLDMNVHANEQWLKAAASSGFLSLLLSIGQIPANNDGRGLCLAEIAELAGRAKFNGVISVGKLLTAAQRIAVSELTGDDLAWTEVQNNGYWADVAMVEEVGPSGIAEYVAKYTLAYAKNDVVRKIEGSHNLV
jgi:hypothetical protein